MKTNDDKIIINDINKFLLGKIDCPEDIINKGCNAITKWLSTTYNIKWYFSVRNSFKNKDCPYEGEAVIDILYGGNILNIDSYDIEVYHNIKSFTIDGERSYKSVCNILHNRALMHTCVYILIKVLKRI